MRPLDFLRDRKGLAIRLVLAEVLGPRRGLRPFVPPAPPPPVEQGKK